MITPGAREPVSDSNKTAACSFLSPTEPDCTALQNAWSTLSLRSAVDLPQASTSFKPNDPCQSAPRPSSLQIAWSCPFLPTLPSRRALGSPLKLTWARPRRLFRSACSVPEHKKHEHGDCLAAFAVGARATTNTGSLLAPAATSSSAKNYPRPKVSRVLPLYLRFWNGWSAHRAVFLCALKENPAGWIAAHSPLLSFVRCCCCILQKARRKADCKGARERRGLSCRLLHIKAEVSSVGRG